MKTLVKDNVSLMILPDDVPVVMGETILIGATGRYQINNKKGNHVLYENIVPPENYKGKRFCFDGKTWTTNNNWRGEKLWASIKR